MSIQSFDNLMHCLSASSLSELDLDDKNQIIIKETLKDDESSSPTDPEKIAKIKDLFLQSIQTEMPADTEFSIEDAEKKAEELAQGKKKLLLLEKIEKSPLVENLFPRKDDFTSCVQTQKLAYDAMVNQSTEKLRQFTASASSSQIHGVGSLGRQLIESHTEDHLKLQIRRSIEEMERKYTIPKMISLFEKQVPELNKKMEVLSLSDRELFYRILSCNFASDTNWGKIDLSCKYVEPNRSSILQDFKLFLSFCAPINALKDSIFRDLIKQIIFTNDSWKGRGELCRISTNEEFLAQAGTLIKELDDRNPKILSTWLIPLIRASQDLPSGAETFVAALRALNEYNTSPIYSSQVAVLKQIDRIQREPAFTKELLALPESTYLIEAAEVIPFDQMKSVVHMLVQMPDPIRSSFMHAFSTDRMNSPKGLLPSERTNLIPVLQMISNLPSAEAEVVLTTLTKWIENASIPFISQTHRLFSKEPASEMLKDVNLMLNIITDCNNDPELDSELLKRMQVGTDVEYHHSALHHALFDLPENHWKDCKSRLEALGPDLSLKFNDWVKFLAALKEGESWEDHMAKTTPDFQKRIAKLFELEKLNLAVFRDVLETIVKDETISTLLILGDIYKYSSAGNFIALLEQLKTDPEIVPNLRNVIARKKIYFREGLGNFEDGEFQFIKNMGQMDPTTLALILKGNYSDRRGVDKLEDMMKINGTDPGKLKNLMKIETPEPIIWKRKESGSDNYSKFDMDLIKILEISPSVKEKVSRDGINSIPWDEIPEEIWSLDPELPLKLMKIFTDLKTGASLRKLLLGVILEGKDALAYRLVALNDEGDLNQSVFSLFATAEPGDPLVKSFVQLLEESPSEKIGKTIPFLRETPWAGFNPMLNQVEAMYALPSSGSLEERMQKLPKRWKWALIKLMQLGQSQKELIGPLLNFIQANPQLLFIEFLFKLLPYKELPSLEMIQLFNRFPKEDWLLNKCYTESGWGHFDLLNLWFSKYGDKDPAAIAHLLLLSDDISFKIDFKSKKYSPFSTELLEKDPDWFFNMIESDKQMGPPFGRLISKKFTPELLTLINSNAEVADTIMRVSLEKFDLEKYKDLGNLYLRMLNIHPDHPGLWKILSDPRCVQALKLIDWESVSQPQALMARILTLASWPLGDSLAFLLEGFKDHDAKIMEALFDMATAGYVPEAAAIIQELQKFPTDEKYLRLLNRAGSVNAIDIQRELLNLPEVTPPEPVEWKVSNTIPSLFKERIDKVQAHTFKSDGDKKNALETDCSFALAQAMVQKDGTLTRFPLEDILNYAEIPLDSDFAINLKQSLEYYTTDSYLPSMLKHVGIPPNNSPSAQMIRCHFKLGDEEDLTQWHSQVAVLSAELSRPRQSPGVGTCFGVYWNNATQSSLEGHKYRSLPDYIKLITDNALTRKLSDKNGATFQFPVQLMPKRMQEPILIENLFVKARENVLSTMAGNAKVGFLGVGGLFTKNVQTFDLKGAYGNKINLLNQENIVVEVPIKNEEICEQLKDSFSALFKAVIEYEKPHPVTEELGWWHLARRDNSSPILDLNGYQGLQLEVLEDAKSKLITKYPEQTIYLRNLFNHLIKYSQSDDAVDDIVFPYAKRSPIEKMKETPWSEDTGGISNMVAVTDAQFVGEPSPFVRYAPNSAEEMVSYLFDFYTGFPEREKESFLKEPLRLHPTSIPSHSMCLVPTHILAKMSAGKTSSDIIAELKSPSSIMMKEIDKTKREEWMEKWIKTLPFSIQIPFKLAMASQEMENMSLESCGQTMMKTFFKLYRSEPEGEWLREMEDNFLELLPSELQAKMPFLIVGDLNWDKRDYNNIYLACGCSPLTGKLTWYKCNRKGAERRQYHRTLDNFSILEPISRQEEGHLTYLSLKK